MNSRISYKVNVHKLDGVLALIFILVGAESVPVQNHVFAFNAAAAASTF